MNEEDMKIVETMEKYGGSFVKHLAQLCYRADPTNLELIKKTWSHYWAQYKEMAENHS